MIVGTLIFLWLATALLFTGALCWVASQPRPKFDFPEELDMAGNSFTAR